MKTCYEIEQNLGDQFTAIIDYDKKEIDNPDKYHHHRINYLDRVNFVISLVEDMFPVPNETFVGDFACAQANIALQLGELGYNVTAIDIDSTCIEYARMKYERGNINWVLKDIDRLESLQELLHVAIAGEFIEHCAYPEEIIAKILTFVRPGGLLILTTPNGSYFHYNLPTFHQVADRQSRRKFQGHQFGPDGPHHLFLFTLDEINYIIPQSAKIIQSGYLGGTVLINKYSRHVLRILPLPLVEKTIRMLSRVPFMNKKTFYNIYAVVRKN